MIATPHSRHVHIVQPADLGSLMTTGLWRAPGQVFFHLPATFLHPERESWEAAISRHYNACGCAAGGVAMMMALVSCLWIVVPAHHAGTLASSQAIWITVAGVVFGTATGKFVGLLVARYRLRRVVAAALANWTTAEHGPSY